MSGGLQKVSSSQILALWYNKDATSLEIMYTVAGLFIFISGLPLALSTVTTFVISILDITLIFLWEYIGNNGIC